MSELLKRIESQKPMLIKRMMCIFKHALSSLSIPGWAHLLLKKQLSCPKVSKSEQLTMTNKLKRKFSCGVFVAGHNEKYFRFLEGILQ